VQEPFRDRIGERPAVLRLHKRNRHVECRGAAGAAAPAR
jgi:hypothetical protein